MRKRSSKARRHRHHVKVLKSEVMSPRIAWFNFLGFLRGLTKVALVIGLQETFVYPLGHFGIAVGGVVVKLKRQAFGFTVIVSRIENTGFNGRQLDFSRFRGGCRFFLSGSGRSTARAQEQSAQAQDDEKFAIHNSPQLCCKFKFR